MTGRAWLLALALCAGAVTAGAEDSAFPWPKIRPGAPVENQFTVVDRHPYRERAYEPGTVLPLLDAVPEGGAYGGPEHVLASLLGASRAVDFEWWLATWDAPTRGLLERLDAARGLETLEQRAAAWAEGRGGRDGRLVVLTRWVERGQHIVIAYRREAAPGASAEDAEAVDGREKVAAFGITAEGWKATLGLTEDLVFRHLTEGVDEVERWVRSEAPKP